MMAAATDVLVDKLIQITDAATSEIVVTVSWSLYRLWACEIIGKCISVVVITITSAR